jgi:preprotein translocase SecE subunit
MAKNLPTGPGGRPPLPNMRKGFGSFFKEVGVEMRKVIWPSRAETIRLTTAVLFVCVVFVAYLIASGFLIDRIVTFLETGRF